MDEPLKILNRVCDSVDELQEEVKNDWPDKSIPLIPVRYMQSSRNLLKNPRTLIVNGPNNSGKTAFLNNLLKQDILQSGDGNVTGRILQLQYAPAEASRIYEISRGSITKEESLTAIVHDDVLLEKVIASFTARPVKSEQLNYEEELNLWCRKIVVLEIPNQILESGIILVDTPGYNLLDESAIQDAMCSYIKRENLAIIFTYSNATFGNNELTAFRLLRKQFLDVEFPPIFFLSTFADLSSFTEPPVHWNEEIESFDNCLHKCIESRREMLLSSLEKEGCKSLIELSYGFGVISNYDVRANEEDGFYTDVEIEAGKRMLAVFHENFKAWSNAQAAKRANYLNQLITSELSYFQQVILSENNNHTEKAKAELETRIDELLKKGEKNLHTVTKSTLQIEQKSILEQMGHCLSDLDSEIDATGGNLDLLRAAMTKVLHERAIVIVRESISKVSRDILRTENTIPMEDDEPNNYRLLNDISLPSITWDKLCKIRTAQKERKTITPELRKKIAEKIFWHYLNQQRFNVFEDLKKQAEIYQGKTLQRITEKEAAFHIRAKLRAKGYPDKINRILILADTVPNYEPDEVANNEPYASICVAGIT